MARTELDHLFEKAHEAVKYAIKDLLELKLLNKEKVESADSLIDTVTVYASMLRKIIEWDKIPSFKALELIIIRHIERIIDHTQYIEQYLAEL